MLFLLFLTLLLSLSRCIDAETRKEFLLETTTLPSDLNFMPSLSNGHLGFTVFGDAIFVNGVYNGQKGNSRRARLPNWINISATIYEANNSILDPMHNNITYVMNLSDGYFQWSTNMTDRGIVLQQRVYAHRFYNRALIYELLVERQTTKETVTINLQCNPGSETDAFDLVPMNVNENEQNIKVIRATTKEVEHKLFQPHSTEVYIAFSDDLPERQQLLKMDIGQERLRYRFAVTVDINKQVALEELHEVMSNRQEKLFDKHCSNWRAFWNNFSIDVKGHLELSQIINAGIFYMASSLPSIASNMPNNPYFGLSPTGLARGQLDADYEGHNFWDTEIWMLPVVTQMHNGWSKELFNYRLDHLHGAIYNANITGFEGARFPWESAFTGTEVTNPCCPEVAKQEIHISADIVIALQGFYETTFDRTWLCSTAWPLACEIATFLVSRTEFNLKTNKYHILDVMGPDEDHEHVDDNVYTNVAVQKALRFASYVQSQCSANSNHTSVDWLDLANNMFILYDPENDFHPQYSGYKTGEQIKQADTILLGYPVHFEMNNSTRHNDLKLYENVTRQSGPAMTWSMFAINFFEIGLMNKADFYFLKGYRKYVRPEFKVWSETEIGFNGSTNFLTGIGGFLQSIIFGYAGIQFEMRDNITQMSIRNPATLPGTNELNISGWNN
ncbi:protein-glucosylgalactosylhydroxylysine glucosidase [Musca vetustissima]|uniref:protein-glucosylgalactosylhydroxylysine glucosidase n=1 Tax=Musca vetustissima TaxID=27455 RepID=UPI002AB62CB8|nr:protein-glucosylgalactosylhydroxylysine glucosidase [Musca vetustissima]